MARSYHSLCWSWLQEAVEGYKKCVMEQNDPETVKARAMQDPEVQQILGDPAMQLILQQMQKDPKALQEWVIIFIK